MRGRETTTMLPHGPSPLAGEGGSHSEPGEGNARRVALARSMRHRPTDAERALWYLLRDRRFSGFKFRRQVPVGHYIVDFACLSARLIVEADGGHHNGSPRDSLRDAWFRNQGFSVLRFWNFDILNRRTEVSDTLWHALQRLSSPPHPAAAQPPSPARGEGFSSAGITR